MRWIVRVLLVVVAVPVVLFAGFLIGRETRGIVIVRTTDSQTQTRGDRLWHVEYEGRTWVRGNRTRTWLQRVETYPDVEVVLEGRTARCRAVSSDDPAVVGELNELFHAKYGVLDEFLKLKRLVVPGGAKDVVVRLDPTE